MTVCSLMESKTDQGSNRPRLKNTHRKMFGTVIFVDLYSLIYNYKQILPLLHEVRDVHKAKPRASGGTGVPELNN